MKMEYLHKIFRITEIEIKNMKVELRVLEEIGNGGVNYTKK